MTFEELERKLPNGFHDAAISEIRFDFPERSATIGIDILTGAPDGPNPELCRPGKLRVAPIYLFFIEPPDPNYPFLPSGLRLKVDGDPVKVGQNAELDRLLPTLPHGATAYRSYFEKWNAYLYVAGGGVELSWDNDATCSR